MKKQAFINKSDLLCQFSFIWDATQNANGVKGGHSKLFLFPMGLLHSLAFLILLWIGLGRRESGFTLFILLFHPIAQT